VFAAPPSCCSSHSSPQSTLHTLCQHAAVLLSLKEGHDGVNARRLVTQAAEAAPEDAASSLHRVPTISTLPLSGGAADAGREGDSAPPSKLRHEWLGLAREAGWALELRSGVAAVAEAERVALRAVYRLRAGAQPLVALDAGASHCFWAGVTCGSEGGADGVVPVAGVVELRLPSAGLSGHFPCAAISGLKSLQILDLSFNAGLRGSLPADCLAAAPRLRALALRGCRMGGAPPPLPEASDIAWLDVSDNSLAGPLPDSWARAATLRMLNASHNALDGPLPDGFSRLTQLEALSLAHNRLSGTFPADALLYPGPPRLALLDLSSNALHGRLRAADGAPPISRTLLVLDLSGNALVGHLPPLPPRLRIFALADNQLSGPLPSEDELRAASASLRHLDLRNNMLSGSFPAAMLQLTALRHFDVSGNELITGHLPAGGGGPLAAQEAAVLRAGAWAALTHLGVARTALGGSLPPALFARSSLRELHAGRCALSGVLPCAEMASASVLTHIDLAANALEGRLCSQLGELLRALTYIDVSSNRLSGRVPLALTTLETLTHLNLTGNSLRWEFV